ncbi:hypothetical protein RIF29_11607 [Crotalaria pallida]|uniref:Uncharacterized protein n=1 Tax=Crotalaria pallida TaxID=3830 RepID=A0AAN9IMC2_CROPI
MDREQEEMKSLGLFGVYKESYKIIFSWRKIFSQITLTLILPLSFSFLIHIEVSNVLFKNLMSSTEQMLSSEWATFWLFKLFYFTFLLIFSLLSTSAVVYTIASIYIAREVTFNKVMSVLPKVWKRLVVTFLCISFALFAYSIIALLVTSMLIFGVHSDGMETLVIMVIFYLAGLVYLSGMWQLAIVVSALEDSLGLEAMRKSKKLIKGKMGLLMLIVLKLTVSCVLIQFLFNKVVLHGWRLLGSLDRTAFGILCFLLLSLFFLLMLVLQTVLFFICKSYHHENVDKYALSDCLEKYEPWKAKGVQLEPVTN